MFFLFVVKKFILPDIVANETFLSFKGKIKK